MKRLISIGLATACLATVTVTACSSGDARLGSGTTSSNTTGDVSNGNGSGSTNGGDTTGDTTSGGNSNVSNTNATATQASGTGSGSGSTGGNASGSSITSSSNVSNATAEASACCPSGWTQHDCVYSDGGRGFACHNPAAQCLSSNFCGQGCDLVVADSCGASDAGAADAPSDAALVCNPPCTQGTICCHGGAVGILACTTPLPSGACPALP